MAYSLKSLRANFSKIWANFYTYLLQSLYWGSVPAIVLYGLFAKPYSPLVMAVWSMLTGQEQPQPDYYGPPGGF